MLRKLKSADYFLMLAPILLSLFGVLMVYSASMVVAVIVYKGAPDLFYNRQLKWFIVSLIAFFFVMNIPYTFYLRLRKLIPLASIIVLFIVLIAGKATNNAQSWLQFGGFGFQPSEFVKLGLIIYLAGVFSRKQAYIDKFGPAFLPPIILTSIIFGLVIFQPDFGTGAIMVMIAAVITFCSGMRWLHISRLVGIGVLIAALIIPFALSSEQKSRFTGAYDPFSSPEGDGYQLINSYLAIASGGLKGQGLGDSIQKYGYLPEPHTDFIMAVIAEELGIFGVAFVLFLLVYIIWKGFKLAVRSEDSFASLLAIGISSMIGIQSIINLGALTGLMPITGVPLPFISYGGSSLLLLMVSMGILNNIAISINKAKSQQSMNTQSEKASL